MSDFLIHFSVPEYLAQYYIHKRGGTSPVRLQRGAPEADVLEYFLAPWPVGLNPEKPESANLTIAIPSFKRKDPRTYNYLPPKAARLFTQRIRQLLRIELWNAVTKLHPLPQEQQETIYAFMEQNGISDDETNFLALQKIFQRLVEKANKKSAKNRHDLKATLSVSAECAERSEYKDATQTEIQFLPS